MTVAAPSAVPSGSIWIFGEQAFLGWLPEKPCCMWRQELQKACPLTPAGQALAASSTAPASSSRAGWRGSSGGTVGCSGRAPQTTGAILEPQAAWQPCMRTQKPSPCVVVEGWVAWPPGMDVCSAHSSGESSVANIEVAQGGLQRSRLLHAPVYQSSPPRSPCTAQWGVAYELAGSHEEQERTLHYLEWREKQYDIRRHVSVWAAPGDARPAVEDALVYIAGPDPGSNPDYLGPAPLATLAHTVATAEGPSGPNHVYLFRLANGLRMVGFEGGAGTSLVGCRG